MEDKHDSSPPEEPSSESPGGAAGPWLRFNLREMILVAALVCLLLAALTPWYQARRVRAMVSRVRADMRSMAVALESYYVDNMAYPSCGLAEGPARIWLPPPAYPNFGPRPIPTGVPTIHSSLPAGSGARRSITFRIFNASPGIRYTGPHPHTLTTPLAYLTAYPADLFADTEGATFGYATEGAGWIIWSPGPDRDENASTGPADIGARVESLYTSSIPQPSPALIPFIYDATNGTWSEGDIIRVRQ